MLEDAKFNKNKAPAELVDNGRTWSTNFKVKGTTYAASLLWQPLRSLEDPYTEITEAAQNVLEGADLFCIKRGKSPQFGLCISTQGYNRKMPVAALGVLRGLPETSSFLAVFKVDGGWWYICVRNDVILSDGDMLFVNEDDAKAQFTSMLAVPDWGLKIAPKEWNVEDTRQVDLPSLLKGSSAVYLEKVHALRGTKLLITLALAGIISIWLISSLVSLVFKATPPKPIVAPVALKTVDKAPLPPEPKPWESLENPVQFLSYCFKAIQDVVSIPTPGWHIGGITCSAEGLVTSWQMEMGRLAWIDKALENSGVVFSNRSISPSGREVMASVPIEQIGTFNSPPQYNGVDLVNMINDLFQGLQLSISLNSQTWTSPQGNVYKSVRFSLSSKYDPHEWVDIFTKFSGLTISVIKYDSNSNTWYYEGAIYVL